MRGPQSKLRDILRRGGSDLGQGDEGFTLVELLIVMIILPLIIGGAAIAMVVILDNTIPTDRTGTAARLADSHDAQVTSAYFVRDVQSAYSWTTQTTPVCTNPSVVGGFQLLGLEWPSKADQTAGVAASDVSYYIQPPTGSQSAWTLARYYCAGGSFVSSSIVSYDVFTGASGVTAAAPPSCSGANSCAVASGIPYVWVSIVCTDGSTTVSCPNGGLTPVLVSSTSPKNLVGISSVQIKVLDNSITNFQYTVNGSPRLANSVATTGPPAPLVPPFISNGGVSVGNCAFLSKGIAAVNDSANGSLSIGNGDFSTSGGIYTTDPSGSGEITTGPGGTYGGPVTPGGPVASPYTKLVEPPSSSVYPTVVESTLNWDPSTDASVHVGGSLTKPLIPAIYKITNGMTFGKGVDGSNGVLFYVTGGSVNLGGNGSVILAALPKNWEQTTDGSPAPLPEVVVWISSTDKSPSDPPTLTLGGNGNVTTISGAVYAPTAAVTINGGGSSGGINALSLDIGSISACNGGGSVLWDLTVGDHAASGTVDSATQSAIALTQSDTDTISVIGSITPNVPPTTGPTPPKQLTIYVCGPENPSLGCGPTNPNLLPWLPSASTFQSASLSPVAGTSTSRATSPPFTPTVAGAYCFGVSYPGDGNYSSSLDYSSDACFSVAGPPIPVITSPTTGICYGTKSTPTCRTFTTWPLDAISGTASDPPGGPGIQSVAVTIMDAKGKFWNPADSKFDSPTATPIPATDTALAGDWSTWTYPFPNTNFPNGDTGSYVVTATSTDKAVPPVTGVSDPVQFTWGG
jgi:prepilin-type N-terminal cleavage/methylation domain-containing protein